MISQITMTATERAVSTSTLRQKCIALKQSLVSKVTEGVFFFFSNGNQRGQFVFEIVKQTSVRAAGQKYSLGKWSVCHGHNCIFFFLSKFMSLTIFSFWEKSFFTFLQSFIDEKIDQTVMSVYLTPDQTVNYYSLAHEGAL